MKNKILVFALCLSAFLPKEATTDAETVWLKDVTTRLKTDKRGVTGSDFPDQLSFHLKRMTQALILNLNRNYHIDPNTEIYIAQTLKDGQPILEKMQNMEKADVAYYQDVDNGAFMTARCVKKSSGQCDILINGNIRLGDRSYDMRPSEADVVPNDFWELTGLRGKRYVLQDQENIQSGISFGNNDQSNVIEKELQEKHIDRLLRIQYGQDKPNLILNPDDITRNLKRYYVDVVVLADSGIWDLFLSIERSIDVNDAPNKAITALREYLLHVMNGVDQLYKGITDPRISITVSLRAFVIFQNQQHFPHNISRVTGQGGQSTIDGDKYLQDLTYWDINIGSQSIQAYDQVMLFTRHVISSGLPQNTEYDGRAITSGVCDVGRRVSIVRVNDFFITTRTAAHELGHALGANHDGDEPNDICSSKDEYIMSNEKTTFTRWKRYKENPWLFAQCSVNSFRRKLPLKHCLTNKHVQDQDISDEFERVLRQPTGKRFKPDHQCAIINGVGSKYCGRSPNLMCRQMRCTDPVTRQCQPGHYSAAPGTECDVNKHCKKGVCVAGLPRVGANTPLKRLINVDTSLVH